MDKPRATLLLFVVLLLTTIVFALGCSGSDSSGDPGGTCASNDEDYGECNEVESERDCSETFSTKSCEERGFPFHCVVYRSNEYQNRYLKSPVCDLECPGECLQEDGSVYQPTEEECRAELGGCGCETAVDGLEGYRTLTLYYDDNGEAHLDCRSRPLFNTFPDSIQEADLVFVGDTCGTGTERVTYQDAFAAAAPYAACGKLVERTTVPSPLGPDALLELPDSYVEGRFIDALVDGAYYELRYGATLSGFTGANGNAGSVWVHRDMDRLELGVGAIALGWTTGEWQITPYVLARNRSVQDARTIDAAQDIARLLLALDEDRDASNGLSISAEVDQKLLDYGSGERLSVDPRFGTDGFEALALEILAAAGLDAALPTREEAQLHLDALQKPGPVTNVANAWADQPCESLYVAWQSVAETSGEDAAQYAVSVSGGSFGLVPGIPHAFVGGGGPGDIDDSSTWTPVQYKEEPFDHGTYEVCVTAINAQGVEGESSCTNIIIPECACAGRCNADAECLDGLYCRNGRCLPEACMECTGPNNQDICNYFTETCEFSHCGVEQETPTCTQSGVCTSFVSGNQSTFKDNCMKDGATYRESATCRYTDTGNACLGFRADGNTYNLFFGSSACKQPVSWEGNCEGNRGRWTGENCGL